MNAELQYYKVISRRRYTTASLQRYSSSESVIVRYIYYVIYPTYHIMYTRRRRRGAARRGVVGAEVVANVRTNARGVHKAHRGRIDESASEKKRGRKD